MANRVEQLISIGERTKRKDHRLIKVPIYLRYWRVLRSAALVLADASILLLAAVIARLIRAVFFGGFNFNQFYEILPFIVLSQAMFALRSLYPSIGIDPVNELKRLSISTTFVFLFIAATTFFLQNSESFSRSHLALTWFFGLFMLPLGRAWIRDVFGRIGLYGDPVVIIGCGRRGKEMATYLRGNVSIGLRPVAVIDSFEDRNGRSTGGVPVFYMSSPEQIVMLSELFGVDTAIILTAGLPNETFDAYEKIREGAYKRLILVPDREQIGGLGIKRFDLGMVYGLEIERNLFNNWDNLVKRAWDVFLVIFGGLLISPVLLLISLIIKLDSKGPLFYGHARLGVGGKKFKAWKFRTMVPNANRVLEEYLETNPELRKEWEATFKLQNDPRVTRVGRILRRLSLDELPQIWNVLKGEMSVVGPRPIVNDEISYYGERYNLYSFVKPGITGLWQVSGRNDTTYGERVRLDEHYVRNWSLWMDMYILARTVSVVLNRKGAY